MHLGVWEEGIRGRGTLKPPMKGRAVLKRKPVHECVVWLFWNQDTERYEVEVWGGRYDGACLRFYQMIEAKREFKATTKAIEEAEEERWKIR